MAITRRVFVSMPMDGNLMSRRQKDFKAALLALVRRQGFEPQEFFVSGIAGGMSWSFRAVDDVIQSKGKERALIIREKGAKMPADVGGDIYLELANRRDISAIKPQLDNFLRNRL